MADKPSSRKRRRGAPKGNTNALKHGRRSRRFAEIGALVASRPGLADALLRSAANQARTGKQIEEDVAMKFAGLYLHAESIAKGEPSPGPFLYLLTGDPADIQAGIGARNAILRDAADAIARREARNRRKS